MKNSFKIISILLIAVLGFLVLKYGKYGYYKLSARKTVQQRISEFGEEARNRFKNDFKKADIQYPPDSLALIGFKKEEFLEVYAKEQNGVWKFVKNYPIVKQSGVIGPKLMEGDYQVPEGIYKIEYLNPNSMFHVSLKISYPNDFDKKMGIKDNRHRLGGDIMIHGSNVSVGCLAIGDNAAEEIFTMAADIRINKINVIISPIDFRISKITKLPKIPWINDLYSKIEAELKTYPIQ